MFAVSKINKELMPQGTPTVWQEKYRKATQEKYGLRHRQFIEGEIHMRISLWRDAYFTSNQWNANLNYNATHFKIIGLSKFGNLISIKCWKGFGAVGTLRHCWRDSNSLCFRDATPEKTPEMGFPKSLRGQLRMCSCSPICSSEPLESSRSPSLGQWPGICGFM